MITAISASPRTALTLAERRRRGGLSGASSFLTTAARISADFAVGSVASAIGSGCTSILGSGGGEGRGVAGASSLRGDRGGVVRGERLSGAAPLPASQTR